MAKTARDAALDALTACRRRGAWSESALKESTRGLERREAALASCLCYGVLQNRLLLQFWLSDFVRGKLQPVVEDILLLALYQLRFLDKIPASAAVNEAVEQTKRRANAQAARLVNAVLRSTLRAEELPMPQDMATRYSHPAELTALLTEQFGAEKTRALLQSHNKAPSTVVQINLLRATAAQTAQSLAEAGAQWSPHPWLKNCLTVSGTGELERLEAFRRGWFYVQDAAARLAVEAAELRPEQRVLDCCAAPGGKSFAAAIAMENRGSIVSCDIHPHKIKLLQSGAERLGITCMQAVLHDARQPVAEWTEAFDTVLVDAPCSGLGVIRKKPDIRYKALAQIEALPELQGAILSQQANYVRRGGVLIYSTCTVLRRENEDVAARFLAEHPDFRAETVHYPVGSGIPDGAMTTLLPCDHGTDGFFITKFRRLA